MAGSSQWSSPPLSTTDPIAFPDPVERVSRHAIHTGDSGLYDNGSQSTGSSGHRKELSPYESALMNTHYYIPQVPNSVSDDPENVETELMEVLQQSRLPPRHHHHHHHHHRNHSHHPHQLHFPLSQESDYLGQQHYPASYRGYGGRFNKPGSPASSSEETSSLASSVQQRLGSGPVSEASFNLSQSTSSSSRSGYIYRLPRPSIGGSSTPNPQLPPSRQYCPTVPELEAMASQGSRISLPQSVSKKGHYGPEYSHHRNHGGDRLPLQLQQVVRNTAAAQPKGEGKGERNSFTMKLDMVMSLMSVLSTTSKSDEDSVKLLLALSQSSETCSVLRQSMCINHLLQILHNTELKMSGRLPENRLKAAEALHNIIDSNSDQKQRRCELSVLGALEKVRAHCDMLFEFIHSSAQQQHVSSTHLEELQKSCTDIMIVLRKLFKYSNERELYRPAILSLGGLQAMAEILVVDYCLPAHPKAKMVKHSSDTIAITITILINLTYGDISNKHLICAFPHFLKSLMQQVYSMDEQVVSKAAQVLRNLSCKASSEIKEALLHCHAAVALMEAVDHANSETTIQHITSALWNISAHSVKNRNKICQTPNGICTLVGLLSYNSPSGATVVVENVGGVLRNLSNVISLNEEYRRVFREAGGLAKIVQHLKSKNHTVLSNSTGILWNLSARCADNQKLLWDLGCVPLLDVLQTHRQKNIAENARAALRNLLSFGQSNGWTHKGELKVLSAKTRRAHYSKSASTLPQSLSQSSSHGTDLSLDTGIHSGRRSAPYSSGSVMSSSEQMTGSPDKMSLRSAMPMRQMSASTVRPGDEYFGKQTAAKFVRVASAPGEEEWMNYRPGGNIGSSPEFLRDRHPVHHGSGRKVVCHSQQHVQMAANNSTHPYSYSQSDESEFHSVGLSPHLPTEVLEAPIRHGQMILTEYANLEVDEDDLENDDVTRAVSHSGANTPGSQSVTGASTTFGYSPEEEPDTTVEKLARKHLSLPSGSSLSLKSSPQVLHKLVPSSSRLGTRKLNLDGTFHHVITSSVAPPHHIPDTMDTDSSRSESFSPVSNDYNTDI